ncbi:laccase, multicopper oxidase, benzenediol:oxygen oxidorectuctase [Onygenales sp. PD_40]|nr:laccase, multicopper oxidase, benzenediol:oxygen oxidorectuctase [Onygenales sp. PD_40]
MSLFKKKALFLLQTLLSTTAIHATPAALGDPIFGAPIAERAASCEHSPTSRGCWGEYNIATDYMHKWPETGEIKEYWLSAQNVTLAPDGVEREVLAFNGTYPGPLIEANWGDTLIIHVKNDMEHNGTAIHWHGIRQLNSNDQDGVPGVTQCAIAPGETYTYKFQATQYGTSWYHSHFSAQLGDGLYGPLVIHGPATANYDIDLGPIHITEWFHETSWVLWERHNKNGGIPLRPNAVAENGLINGTNVFPCDKEEDPNCTDSGKRSETTFVPGKKHRIRVIDSQVDGWMRFSIDGHKLTVIAADFVPIVPYEAESIVLAPGQRYDVIVEANQAVDNYWMRAIYVTGCNQLTVDNNDISGIIRYEGADTTVDPTTERWADIPNECADEPYDNLVPYVQKNVGEAEQQETLKIGWFYEWDLVFHWAINTKHLMLDWGQPTNKFVYNNDSNYPDNYAIHKLTSTDKWTYWVIQDLAIVNAYHPFHLHGHDFSILAQGKGVFTKATVPVNRRNPPRRDTATMPGTGYIVIAFETDNPGSWLMHCHIAWHASQSMAMQFVEREGEIVELVGEESREQFERTCKRWNEWYPDSVYKQNDSGI